MPPVRSKVSKRRRRQNRRYISPSRVRGYRRQQTPQTEYTTRGQDLRTAVPTATAMDIDDVDDTNPVITATSPRGHLSGSGVLIVLPPVH